MPTSSPKASARGTTAAGTPNGITESKTSVGTAQT
jgi:hypothetical protein